MPLIFLREFVYVRFVDREEKRRQEKITDLFLANSVYVKVKSLI